MRLGRWVGVMAALGTAVLAWRMIARQPRNERTLVTRILDRL